MAQEAPLLKALKQFMMTGTLKQKKVAIAAYTNLQAYANSLPTSIDSTDKENAGNQQEETSSSANKAAGANAAAPRATTLMNEGATIYTYTVFVSGLTSDQAKREVEQALLKIKGVISIYCDIVEYKAVIRATIPVQDIIDRLHIDGKTASLRKKDIIPEDAAGEESGYLDESDTTSPTAAPGQGSSWFGFGSLVTFGSETPEDRKARLERERKEQGSWFGKIGKALYIM